jgi:hypothetical protein
MKNNLSVTIPLIKKTKTPISSPGFLKWMAKKRNKKKQEKKILKRFFEIKNLIVKRNVFEKLYVFGKMRQAKRGRGWKKVTKNFWDTKGKEPPFVIKKWFFENANL